MHWGALVASMDCNYGKKLHRSLLTRMQLTDIVEVGKGEHCSFQTEQPHWQMQRFSNVKVGRWAWPWPL